jgi:fucose permease
MVGRLIGSALSNEGPGAKLLTAFTAIACAMCLYVFAVGA